MGSYIKGTIILSLILNYGQLAILSHADPRTYTPKALEDSSEYPFVVAVIENNYIRGSGVIIRDDIVLTAAHIVCRLKSVTIIAGRTFLKSTSDNPQISRVSKIIPHGAYTCSRDRSYKYNIAILVLEDDLEFNDKVNAISLPNAKSSLYFVNKMAIVAGWGRASSSRRPSNILLAANLTILSDPECYEESVGVLELNDDGICAVDRTKSGKGVCWGDSGSVLFIRSEDFASNYTLLGFASDVFSRTGRCQVQFPSPFSSVLYLKNFIEKITLENQGARDTFTYTA